MALQQQYKVFIMSIQLEMSYSRLHFLLHQFNEFAHEDSIATDEAYLSFRRAYFVLEPLLSDEQRLELKAIYDVAYRRAFKLSPEFANDHLIVTGEPFIVSGTRN